ncbi:hypothetical protein HanXRQr2_Chr17g0785551 [Helianthus annuus]|uniref:Uncharacterized protein n=1 Tax=Helianthus annuus TaxID=4232 RepID=A0A9K3DGM3_HELAN|nr:hypothetical protein HanXRQr2_Chr17g0785551 [Helianthus annuus]KAJ0446218.1 hypothetical protein HanHA89_Chr17g0691961 [Helianthus annuus]
MVAGRSSSSRERGDEVGAQGCDQSHRLCSVSSDLRGTERVFGLVCSRKK